MKKFFAVIAIEIVGLLSCDAGGLIIVEVKDSGESQDAGQCDSDSSCPDSNDD